ncbi:unnamed protein product [Lota lota]
MNSDRREWDFSIRALTAADRACVAALLVKLERIATLLEIARSKPPLRQIKRKVIAIVWLQIHPHRHGHGHHNPNHGHPPFPTQPPKLKGRRAPAPP